MELVAGRAFSTSRPLVLTRIEATLPLRGAPLPRAIHAYGELPDRTPFALTTKPAPDGVGQLIQLKPQHPTQVHEWFSGQLPFTMSAAGITLCSGCQEDTIAFDSVAMTLPTLGTGLGLTTPEAIVRWQGDRAMLGLEQIAVQGLRDAEAQIKLSRTQFTFETATGSHTGELEVEAGEGRLTMSWLWDAPSQLVSVASAARAFSLRPLFVLLGTSPFLHQGVVSGQVDGTLDVGARVIDARVDLTVRDAAGHIPGLSREALETSQLGLKAHAVLDVGGQSLSVLDGALTLANVAPLKLSGHLLRAGQAWQFDAQLEGRDLDAEALRVAAPAALIGPIRAARFAGMFDVDLSLRGHSAYPDGLQLTLGFGGEVQVLSDGASADMETLSAPGAPIPSEGSELRLPEGLGPWTLMEALPSHVPRTITAAEDARFMLHNGFDFGGLARAMAHNLKVGRLERGGSTITQQLVKNLYLGRERTAARKLQEAYLTWRLERALGKVRILELYLNIAEWGPQVRGLAQAAQAYFQTTPDALTVEQTALLGAILPGPKLYGAPLLRGQLSSSRVTKIEHIVSNLRFLGEIDMATYHDIMARAWRGEIGGLTLQICADDDTAPEGTPRCGEAPAQAASAP